MKVNNVNNLPLIDYRKVKPLQGELKDLSTENYKKLASVLNKRGFTTPLFIWNDGTDNYLMDGHQRQRVMLGEDMQPYEVPYILIEADNIKDAKAQLLEITSQYGTITQEGFDTYIAQAEIPEAEMMESINFDALNWMQPEPEVEEDEAPEVSSEPPKSKLGEIYQLGRHRVMCGDSTEKNNVALLMDGARADMVFTDPPYGVDYSGRGQNTSDKIQNDALSIEDTELMVSQALINAYEVSREGTTCFVWHADSKPELRPLFERSFTAAGWRLASTIIWLKNQASMGFQDYRSQHEPCLYGWRGTKQERVKDRTQTTVWKSGRDSNYQHPTQKPVFLAANAISNHNPGTVLDLFLGSGSTLMACEQTDRTCYGMELDPKYVDVIRKRYYNYMFDQPEYVNAPVSWEEYTPSIKRLQVN